MKNHNYSEILGVKELKAILAKAYKVNNQEDLILFWSGENAFYFGGDVYGGLGATGDEPSMRNDMRKAYNGDLAPLIAAHAKYQNVEIVELKDNPADNAKISLMNGRRIHN